MRVYELSKELGVSSKEILDALKDYKTDVKNHMSALDTEAVSFIKKRFKKAESSKEAPESIMQKESHIKTKPSVSKQKDSQFRKKAVQEKPVEQRAPLKRAPEPVVIERPEQITLKSYSLGELSTLINVPIADLILMLLQWGIVTTINQRLQDDVVERIAKHFEIKTVKATQKHEPIKERVAAQGSGKLSPRLPVIVVLGHVDHGKTTLLDYIRKTRVVAKEKGGITQHLGAYEAKTAHGNLIFLDTPGHEAFPKMRQRGIKVADIAILVIAADDGIMPQTIEVIKNLKQMHIPIVVAMNKVDKVEPNRLETVKRQLAEHDLLPEEWGGQVICMPVSASQGTGVDQLVEMVALQAQLLELQATTEGNAKCYVLESKFEKGRGAVATLICQHGTLRVGDYFTCGKTTGRVSSIKNSFGKTLTAAEPSKPVQIAGFKELPEAGDLFSVIDKADIRKFKPADSYLSSNQMHHAATENAINLIIKTDTNSSKEAVTDAINNLSQKLKTPFTLVHTGVGDINESDVELAYNTGSSLIGLHVKAESNARSLIKRRGVSLLLHDIIYKLLEELEERVHADKPVEMERVKVGEAIVRKVFDIKGIGVIAGSYVQDGRFSKNGHVVAWRGRQKIGEGPIVSLQRDKKTVKEVHTGYECGFVVEGIDDWQENDRAECYVNMPKK